MRNRFRLKTEKPIFKMIQKRKGLSQNTDGFVQALFIFYCRSGQIYPLFMTDITGSYKKGFCYEMY